jgi:DNA-binding response OmpR family regulator
MPSILLVGRGETFTTLRRAVSEREHSITSLTDGREALEACSDTPFDLVLIELSADPPGVRKLIATLRETGHHAKICLIQDSDGSTLSRSADVVGADAVLVKPLGVSDVREAVRLLLSPTL